MKTIKLFVALVELIPHTRRAILEEYRQKIFNASHS
jgi:hypothetical protein